MNQIENLKTKDFSLILGGPFFQLLQRTHLTGGALELIKLRTITITLIAWLPLLLISIFSGQAWGSGTNLSFIQDIEVHIRFLLALPLMIVAELVVHQRMLSMVKQFQARDLIPETGVTQFNNAIAAAFRLRNSYIAELLMVVIIYVIGYQIVWRQSMALDTSAWYSVPAVGKGNLSLAGIWFRYISLPFFQFLFLRWYYRLFIWARFLFQVSRIKLRLIPTHPDQVGGLGFLSNIVYAFMPLAVMHGALLSGTIANHIFHEGAVLTDYKIELVIVIILVLCLSLLPLFTFTAQLGEAKRAGSLEYGTLAARYVHEFDAKWNNVNKPCHDSLLGSSDIQSLADLINSHKVVENMQIAPISKKDIILLTVATLAPVLPLVLTMMPLSELLAKLAGVLF